MKLMPLVSEESEEDKSRMVIICYHDNMFVFLVLDVVCGFKPTSASCACLFPSILNLHTHSSFVTGFVSKWFLFKLWLKAREKERERERETEREIYGSLLRLLYLK